MINPIVLLSTAVAFGSWQMALWRAGLTLLFAVIVGVLVGTASDPQQILVAPTPDHYDHDHHDHAAWIVSVAGGPATLLHERVAQIAWVR